MSCSLDSQRYCGSRRSDHRDEDPYTLKEVKKIAKECGLPLTTLKRKGHRSHTKAMPVLCRQLRTCSRGSRGCPTLGERKRGKSRSKSRRKSRSRSPRRSRWGVPTPGYKVSNKPLDIFAGWGGPSYASKTFSPTEYGPLRPMNSRRSVGAHTSITEVPSSFWSQDYATSNKTRDFYNTLLEQQFGDRRWDADIMDGAGGYTPVDRNKIIDARAQWPALPAGVEYRGKYSLQDRVQGR